MGREGTGKGVVTECQESLYLIPRHPHIRPPHHTPTLQEQTTQARDEAAMTGECVCVQPPDLGSTMPCRMDRMTDRGMKQRPLQTQVTKWSLFFPYFNFNEQGGPKGQASPSPGPWRACCQGACGQRGLLCCFQPPVRWKGPLLWALGCEVEEEGLCLWSTGQEIQGA